MPVWLVTGGTGFLGRHLLDALEALQAPGVELVVIGRRRPQNGSSARFIANDLHDHPAIVRVINATAPDAVFHLAGRTPKATPAEYYRANTLTTVQLLDALRDLKKTVRVVLAGSAAELGPLEAEDLPVTEDYRCRPTDGYGLSKLLATTAGLAARPPLEVITARIFNPIGPGLPYTQAFGRFASELAECGRDPLCLEVGDLESSRDFVDVRDVARALVALACDGVPGTVYNVGTGQSHSVGDGLKYLIDRSGRSVRVERSLQLGPREPTDSRADIRRLVAATGWQPRVEWHQSLGDLWEEARRCEGRLASDS